MAFSIERYVLKLLKESPGKRFTARELATQIMERFPNDVEEKRKRSRAVKISLESDDAMLQQIVAEIGAQRPNIQRKHSEIKTTEGRPRQFYFTTLSDEDELADLEIEITELDVRGLPNQLEANLYPILSKYLRSELGVFSMRIDERRAKNSRGKGGNRWLFPDVVGMEDLSSGWIREIIDTAKEYSDKKTKLWSFEVKLRINLSNVREVYFQAVSNSSWSNFGYLVAAEIEGGASIRELRMLAASHGVGLIRLDVQNPAESQILIPAQENLDIDWDNANRLAEENEDFIRYIQLVRQFYQTGDPRSKDWD
ncbi:MAG: HrgA protein [Pseudomonadota bacterium]